MKLSIPIDNEFVIVLTCVLNHMTNYSSCNWNIWDSVSYKLLDIKYWQCCLWSRYSIMYEFVILQEVNSPFITKFKQFIYSLNKRSSSSQLNNIYLCICLNFNLDKYLLLTVFFCVGCPELENIDKFSLKGTSQPSSCLGTRLIRVIKWGSK